MLRCPTLLICAPASLRSKHEGLQRLVGLPQQEVRAHEGAALSLVWDSVASHAPHARGAALGTRPQMDGHPLATAVCAPSAHGRHPTYR